MPEATLPLIEPTEEAARRMQPEKIVEPIRV